MNAINRLKKNILIRDPRKKLETLLVSSAFFIGYLYLYVYQSMLHINVKLVSFESLYQMPLVAGVILGLIHYIIVKPDPLQRSPSRRKAIRFFQKEFPSKYLLDRCNKCVEDRKSCANYIKEESFDHIRYWFYDIFHGPIEKEYPGIVKDTFAKGYTCKLLYYLSWVLGVFIALSIGTIMAHHLHLYVLEQFKIDFTAPQVLFPLVCVGVLALIRLLNKSDEERPSGCWQAWRQINRIHVGWLRTHEDFLVDLICRAGGNDKQFRQK
ncbi:MAG: hypothetical protein OEZ47_16510 [Gammaproteobacteria bacterium]|nr:hypothetical protein [Gammaproteobacteria bacterium]